MSVSYDVTHRCLSWYAFNPRKERLPGFLKIVVPSPSYARLIHGPGTLFATARRENLWVTRTSLIGEPGPFREFCT